MSICILFILFNGSGYLTPTCYDGYELITPHSVAFVQHIPSEYEYNLYESPDYYLDYYWNAREEYCGNERRREWVAGHYSHSSYIPGHWVGGLNSWGQGWAFWTPRANRAKNQALCGNPRYLQDVHYYSVPYRVRNNVKRRLKTKRHYHYKNSYKKHREHKKYKKYGKRKNHHTNYKKRPKMHSKKHRGTSYKKRKNQSGKYKKNRGNYKRRSKPNGRRQKRRRPRKRSRRH